MAPYEALLGRPCRSPICWTEVGESFITGPDLIKDTSEKVGLIRKHLLTCNAQKKYLRIFIIKIIIYSGYNWANLGICF